MHHSIWCVDHQPPEISKVGRDHPFLFPGEEGELSHGDARVVSEAVLDVKGEEWIERGVNPVNHPGRRGFRIGNCAICLCATSDRRWGPRAYSPLWPAGQRGGLAISVR